MFRSHLGLSYEPQLLYRKNLLCPDSNPVLNAPGAGKYASMSSFSSWLPNREKNNPNWRYPAGSYAITYWTLVRKLAGNNSSNFKLSTLGYAPAYKMNRLRRPAKSIIFCDGTSAKANQYRHPYGLEVNIWDSRCEDEWTGNNVAFRHKNRAQLAFLDGHAAGIGNRDMYGIANAYYSLTEFDFALDFFYNPLGQPN